jgi:hypothetical protein
MRHMDIGRFFCGPLMSFLVLALVFTPVEARGAGGIGEPCLSKPGARGPAVLCSEGECRNGWCIHCGYPGELACADRAVFAECDFSKSYGMRNLGGYCVSADRTSCGHIGYMACKDPGGHSYCYTGIATTAGGDVLCRACGDLLQPCCTYTEKPCDYGKCSNSRYPHTNGFCMLATAGTQAGQAPAAAQAKPVDCSALRKRYAKECDDLGKRYSALNCQKHNNYSGCAKDAAGCFFPYWPDRVFTDKACSTPGLLGCIEPAFAQYLSCLRSCNERWVARSLPEGFEKCGKQCWDAMDAAAKRCSAGGTAPAAFRPAPGAGTAPAVRIPEQEVRDIVNWGIRNNRRPEDIQRDLDSRNSALGGSGRVKLPEALVSLEFPDGKTLTVTRHEADQYLAAKMVLATIEDMKLDIADAERQAQRWTALHQFVFVRWLVNTFDFLSAKMEWQYEVTPYDGKIDTKYGRPSRDRFLEKTGDRKYREEQERWLASEKGRKAAEEKRRVTREFHEYCQHLVTGKGLPSDHPAVAMGNRTAVKLDEIMARQQKLIDEVKDTSTKFNVPRLQAIVNEIESRARQ